MALRFSREALATKLIDRGEALDRGNRRRLITRIETIPERAKCTIVLRNSRFIVRRIILEGLNIEPIIDASLNHLCAKYDIPRREIYVLKPKGGDTHEEQSSQSNGSHGRSVRDMG